MLFGQTVQEVLQVGRYPVFQHVVLLRVVAALGLARTGGKSAHLGDHQVVFLQAVQNIVGLGQAVLEVVGVVVGLEIFLEPVVERPTVVAAQRNDRDLVVFSGSQRQDVPFVLQSGERLLGHLADQQLRSRGIDIGNDVPRAGGFEFVEPYVVFDGQDAAYGFFDLGFADLSFLDGGIDGVDGLFGITNQFQDVVAGFHGHASCLARGVVFGDTLHFHAVGKDQTFVAPLVAHQFFEGFGRERSRERVAGECRYVQVCGHDAGGSVFDQGFEGGQFDRIQAIHVVGDQRQVGMRIDLRVAVSGEVFGCADDAAVFHTFDVGQAFGSYVFRVFTEGTVTDHGVECIVVYVHRRCQVDVQSGAFGLAGDFQSHFIDQVVVLERTQCHLIREAGYVVQTHSQAPFAVDGDEHRGLGGLLQAFGQCSGFGKGALEEHGTAHAQVLRIVECLDDGRRVAGTQLDKDHLSDLFFQGQGVEYRIHPGTVHVLDEFRIFILGVHGEQAHHKGEKQKESFHPVKMVFLWLFS